MEDYVNKVDWKSADVMVLDTLTVNWDASASCYPAMYADVAEYVRESGRDAVIFSTNADMPCVPEGGMEIFSEERPGFLQTLTESVALLGYAFGDIELGGKGSLVINAFSPDAEEIASSAWKDGIDRIFCEGDAVLNPSSLQVGRPEMPHNTGFSYVGKGVPDKKRILCLKYRNLVDCIPKVENCISSLPVSADGHTVCCADGASATYGECMKLISFAELPGRDYEVLDDVGKAFPKWGSYGSVSTRLHRLFENEVIEGYMDSSAGNAFASAQTRFRDLLDIWGAAAEFFRDTGRFPGGGPSADAKAMAKDAFAEVCGRSPAPCDERLVTLVAYGYHFGIDEACRLLKADEIPLEYIYPGKKASSKRIQRRGHLLC